MSHPLLAADPSWMASALCADGHGMPFASVRAWLEASNQSVPLRVRRVPLDRLRRWRFQPAPLRLAHDSGRFFTIEGLRTSTNFGPVPWWDQPIIQQPEIGILGMITRRIRGVRHFLVQAKTEPGNTNGAQISPTLQATASNLSCVHGGRRPLYVEYFTGEARAAVLVDQLHSEQASRFFRKRNRNMVVEIFDDLALEEGFCWLTLGQLKGLLRCHNLVNMDARSVLSCIPLATDSSVNEEEGFSSFGRSLAGSLRADPTVCVSTTEAVLEWLSRLRSTVSLKVERCGLDELEHWTVTEEEIRHESGRYFSVIGVEAQIGNREVREWDQPLLHHPGVGLNGQIVQRIGDALHFLVRACLYPGNFEALELGSTVSRSDYVHHLHRPDAPAFLDMFCDPPPEWVRFDSIQSEEGGRFFQYQNRYMMLELPPGTLTETPPEFAWMTLGQLYALLPQGMLNIEMRNLLACLSFTDPGSGEA